MDWAPIERARMFEQFPAQRVPALFAQLQPQRKMFSKGEVLVHDGQRLNAFAIVESGEFIATKLYRDGRQSLMTKYIPGFLIGIDIAATKKKVSTYYITATRDSVVHTIPYETVAKPGKLPEADRLIMMESILGLIAGENLRKMSQIEIISQKGLRSRILTFLAIQRSFFGCDEFTVPYNREELADYLCVNRSALSHELRRMEQEHLLYCRKNKFRILDAELYSREWL